MVKARALGSQCYSLFGVDEQWMKLLVDDTAGG